MLTLFRSITGEIRAKGVVSVTNAVLHPWLKEYLSAVLAEIEQEHPAATLPPEAERPQSAQWETWLGHPPRTPKPPLRIVQVLDNLAGIGRMSWCSGSSSMGSSRFTRPWAAPG